MQPSALLRELDEGEKPIFLDSHFGSCLVNTWTFRSAKSREGLTSACYANSETSGTAEALADQSRRTVGGLMERTVIANVGKEGENAKS